MIIDGNNKELNEITSFLMIGQSNMAGRGDFEDVDPIDNPLCYMIRMGRWQKMSEPINPDRAIFNVLFHSGVCLTASFADSYAKHFNKKVGLIPCADGGTSVLEWQPGEVLFEHAVFMAKLAMKSSNFGGILWHQGEQDCNDNNFGLYKERLINMITALRKELNAENLPFIIGELAEEMNPAYNFKDYPKKMNLMLHEIEKEVPNCRVVSSKGLSLKPDGIHFNSVSLREFGNRYFNAYLELLKDKN